MREKRGGDYRWVQIREDDGIYKRWPAASVFGERLGKSRWLDWKIIPAERAGVDFFFFTRSVGSRSWRVSFKSVFYAKFRWKFILVGLECSYWRYLVGILKASGKGPSRILSWFRLGPVRPSPLSSPHWTQT